MTFFGTSVGLEIIGHDLRIAVVRGILGKIRVVKYLSLPGFIDQPDEDRQLALTDLLRKNKLSSARAFLALPHEKGILRQMTFPAEVREKLKSAVSLQIEALSPWPVDEIYWDVSEEKAKGKAGTLSAIIAIVPRGALDPWIVLFKSAGLPLSGAALSSLTCAHGVASIWKESVPTLVLGCEADYVEGLLVNGTQLVSVTARGSDTPQLFQSVVDRLLSTARLTSAGNIRLITHGAALESLESPDSMEPVPAVRIPIEGGGADSAKNFGAISSALSAMKRSAFSANLIPPELRFRRSPLALVPTYVLVALLCLLGMATFLREPYQYMRYGSVVDQELQRVAAGANQVSVQEAELNQLSEKYRAVRGHFQGRDLLLESLRELSRILPPTAWVTNFNYQDGGFTISGFAHSASEIQKVLDDSPLFKEVQFTSSVTRDATGQDRFSLKAAIEVPK